jgi:hypothetical protein
MIIKRLQALFFFLLAPIYLVLVYYKTVYDVNTDGLLIVSFMIFLFYLPFQALLSDSSKDISIQVLLENEDATNYLNNLFIFIGFIFIVGKIIEQFGLSHYKTIEITYGLIIYLLWVNLTFKIFSIFAESDLTNILKMLFFLFLILGLIAVSRISNIHESGFAYFVVLIWTVIKFAFFMVFFMPPLYLAALGMMPDTPQNTKKSSSEGSVAFLPVLLGGFLLFVMFMEWFSDFINSFDAYSVALILTTFMIGISAMGTYFQLRIFSATFFKNSKGVSLAALCVFYGVMFVNMNIVSSVEQTSKKIHQSQTSIKSFNNWLQPN